MSTNYALPQNQFFGDGFTPSLDGPGVLSLLMQVASTFDTTDQIDTVNPYNDVLQKLTKAIPEDSPTRREIFQVLSDRAARFNAQGR
jgi:hypothetical protein